MPWFDLGLAAMLLWFAGHAVGARRLHASATVYICFGLLLTLAWVRLDAPDLALAEAALGAGVTGALLLKAIASLGSRPVPLLVPAHDAWRVHEPLGGRLLGAIALAAVLGVVLVGALGMAVVSLPGEAVGLRPEVEARLEASGVRHPVTAVLLNFRGFDTLLEIVVIWIAGVVCWTFPRRRELVLRPDLQLTSLVRFVDPILLVTAAYLLWAGSRAPGGAFQAGVLLGAGAALRLMAGEVLPKAGVIPRFLLSLGALVFLTVGVAAVLTGLPFLGYGPGDAGTWLLVIEVGGTLSIGYALMLLFQRGRGAGA